MKRITSFASFLAAFLLIACFAPMSVEAQQIEVAATLVLGSNNGAGVDPQLKRYEAHLKRVFHFDALKQEGQGSASIELPGSGAIGMGGGHRVNLQAEPAGGGKYRLSAQWSNGNRLLINTTVNVSPNQPTVLGGPKVGSGQLILLLEAR